MVGLKYRNYLNFVWWISCVIVMGWPDFAAIAQSSQDSRVESAILLGDSLQVQVSVPRGQTIEMATLVLADTTLLLDTVPVPLPVTQWLILDQSEGIINIAPTIQTAVNRFLQGTPATTQTGLVLYSDSINRFLPSANQDEISTWLTGYSGRANTPGCIGDALVTVGEQLASIPTSVQRVLLIGGPASRQNVCTGRDFQPLGVPVDVIVLTDEIDTFYHDIIERGGGVLLRANIQTLAARVNEIKALWANPVYALTGTYTGQSVTGDLRLTLANGSVVNLAVQLQTGAALTDSTMPVAANGLSVLQDPLSQIPATEPVTSQTEGAATTVPAPEQIIAQPAVTQSDSVGSNPPTTNNEPVRVVGDIQVMSSEPTPIMLNNPVAEAESAVLLSPQPDIQPVRIDSPKEVAADVTADFSQYLPFIGGGALLLALVLFGVIRSRRSSESRPALETRSSADHTLIEFDQRSSTEIEFQDTGGSGFSSEIEAGDPYDMTEMFDGPVDDFELTEIITEADMLAVVKPPVALLKVEPNGQVYALRRPQTRLGRMGECDIHLSDDRQISREHVVFVITEDDAIHMEVHTHNPVMVNGQRITGAHPLRIGDTLQLSTVTRGTVLALDENNDHV